MSQYISTLVQAFESHIINTDDFQNILNIALRTSKNAFIPDDYIEDIYWEIIDWIEYIELTNGFLRATEYLEKISFLLTINEYVAVSFEEYEIAQNTLKLKNLILDNGYKSINSEERWDSN